MRKVFRENIAYIGAAIAALIVSVFSFPFSIYVIWIFSVVGMVPMLKNIADKVREKKISIDLPIFITLIILLVLEKTTPAAFFLILISLGHAFKEYIKWRVEESVRSISKDLPNTALIKDGEKCREVSIKEIRTGDVVVIKSGGRIPVDGVLKTKEAHLNESVVTGESNIIKKNVGDTVLAGSILFEGYIEIEATRVGEHSTVARIERLVRDSQKEQAKLSSFTTKYASYTVVFTLIAMAVYFAVSRDILQVLALWIALVPVIFAIIVPIATTIGISILAKHGVLVRHAKALEALTKITTIVFDKTGTLTVGNPGVVNIFSAQNFSETEVLSYAAALETYSEHPFSRAVLSAAAERKIKTPAAQDVSIHKGKGVLGYFKKKKIIIGDRDFLMEHEILISEDLNMKAKKCEERGESIFFVSYDSACIGVITIADPLRDGIRDLISRLKRNKIQTVMLTGDSAVVGENIGNELNIDIIHAELNPEDKNVHIKKLQEKGEHVLMIGDGINDAPALSQADVGVAMGEHGITLTLNSAEVILPHNDILKIPYAIESSKKIFRIIKLDLWVATMIHLITAVFVVLNFVDVLGSTLMHQISSMFVLFNTLRVFRIEKF